MLSITGRRSFTIIALLSNLVLSSKAAAAAAQSAKSCGITPITPILSDTTGTDDIVGGSFARPYSWPWQVAINKRHGFWKVETMWCGGSVISPSFIMTAAHCVFENGITPPIPSKYAIRAGVYQSRSRTETGEQERRVAAITMHPKYDPGYTSYDIAIMKLERPLYFSEHIQPVCLACNDTQVVKNGSLFWVTGWGNVAYNGDDSAKLKQAQLPYVPESICIQDYGDDFLLPDVMWCSGKPGKDSCQGDSGGPVVHQGRDGIWRSYGITSWGQYCATKGYPGVNSRTTAYLDFIYNVSEIGCTP